jgi:DNA segregation ATPase FtsK/SpoIIIE, S-DNA-T family
VLACVTALDPLAEMWMHELKGIGDLEQFAPVSHRYVSGLDDEAVGYAAESLRLLRAELERRSAQMKKLPREARPDGKITRDLARRRSLRLYPLVAFFDEVQNCFMHPVFGKQAADDAGHVIRMGRAYGIILVLSTQRPTSETIPTGVTGNVTSRFCLQVPGQVENDTILGTSAYKNGYNAAAFRPKTDAGTGWLKGENAIQVVRAYKLDLADASRVVERAEAARGQAGTLTGYALGQDDSQPPRSFAGDVMSVFGGDEKLWSSTIAARLAESLPSVYADITPAAVSSQLRGLGVEVKNVRERGQVPNLGCWRTAIEGVTP